jgi:hypothetical protein
LANIWSPCLWWFSCVRSTIPRAFSLRPPQARKGLLRTDGGEVTIALTRARDAVPEKRAKLAAVSYLRFFAVGEGAVLAEAAGDVAVGGTLPAGTTPAPESGAGEETGDG